MPSTLGRVALIQIGSSGGRTAVVASNHEGGGLLSGLPWCGPVVIDDFWPDAAWRGGRHRFASLQHGGVRGAWFEYRRQFGSVVEVVR